MGYTLSVSNRFPAWEVKGYVREGNRVYPALLSLGVTRKRVVGRGKPSLLFSLLILLGYSVISVQCMEEEEIESFNFSL